MAEVELRQIGPYSVLRQLKENATGAYLVGKKPQRKPEYVIQVLPTPLISPEDIEAFIRRTRQLKKLTHRNIIEVFDAAILPAWQGQQDHGYLVLKRLPETSITDFLPLGQLHEAALIRGILSPIGNALNSAHISNVLHGNLHPGSLLGSLQEPLLANFALRTRNGLLSYDDEPEAIPYRAPEHLQGSPSSASDQYSLAVMIYEWLCGRRPYTGTTAEELLGQQQQETLPVPSSLNPAISSSIEQILLRALARDPDARFPHLQAFADSYLQVLMGRPIPLDPPRQTPLAPPRTPVLPPSTPIPITPEQEEPETIRKVLPLPKPISQPPVAALASPNVAEAPPSTYNTEVEEQPGIRIPKTPLTFRPRLGGSDMTLSESVTGDLGQGGILSRKLPGYEERPAQIQMAMLTANALSEEVPAIIEAATGTGKSLAYLVPIVRSGKVAIVSTANKALQEQLFYKDIPFVQNNILPFEAALVKGMGNYICLDRLEGERSGLQFYAKNLDFARLLKKTQDLDSSFTGDFETLGFTLPGEIRGKVAADNDQCAWSKCSFFLDCYVRQMRVRAEQAQVIVVNHTLLLLDAAMEGHLLPDRDVIVLDEAHHLEEEATRAFTITISPNQLRTLLSQRMLKDHSQLILQDETEKAYMTLWARLEQIANPGSSGRVNLREPLEEGLRLATVLGDLADSMRKQRPKEMAEKDNSLYDKLVKRAQNLAENTRTVFSANLPERYVYYVERVFAPGQRGAHLEVSAAPLDITLWLKERLFNKCKTVICTSATLATTGPNPARPEEKGPNFAYFRRRIGLDPVEMPEVIERILPLTFDYESNALLYTPRHLPEPAYGNGPNVEKYIKDIAREMFHLVQASQGRAFLLFSSKRMLDNAYDLMAPHLDYLLLRQGELPRVELTKRFREESAVLFGLKSFWEGVDIPGQALSLVVIDKLPFDPPDDPVHEARVAQMKAAGENWFGIYVLPQTVLRLKQGLGRLLRTRDDRGVMALLDTRLHTKGYGRQILNALPPARRTSNLNDVKQFFQED